MKILQITDTHNNDFRAIMECEHCGATQKLNSGYNDNYYHQNVIPAMHCQACGKNREGTLEAPAAQHEAMAPAAVSVSVSDPERDYVIVGLEEQITDLKARTKPLVEALEEAQVLFKKLRKHLHDRQVVYVDETDLADCKELIEEGKKLTSRALAQEKGLRDG